MLIAFIMASSGIPVLVVILGENAKSKVGLSLMIAHVFHKVD